MLALLLACGGSDEPASEESPVETAGEVPVIMAWTIEDPEWGTEWLLVKADGRIRYLLDPPGIRSQATLNANEVQELRSDLRRAQICQMESHRPGEEGESRPTLTVSLAQQRCEVSLHYGEWRRSAIHGTIDALRRRMRHAALVTAPGVPTKVQTTP